MEPSELQICDRDLSQPLLERYLDAEAIAVDTETMGLNPQRDRLCLVQLCDPNDAVTAIRIEKGQTEALRLKQLMEAAAPASVFHFARFDVAQLQHNFGIRTQSIFCTKIASKLARTYTASHGLKALVQELEQIELDKNAQSSDWGDAANLSPAQLRYAANDVRYLLSLRQKLTAMLVREERWALARQCFDCVPVFANLDLRQFNGVFEHK
ncbi:MAG: ribonuclease D [Cyanobacteria bacterium QS_8_64_29]|nr:MAG: ribonuclease D [Cyanobacteria bacterium QS_8_64_29]